MPMSGNCPDPPRKPAAADDESLITGTDRTVMVQAATELGPYRLTKLLGRGGMGEVWQAFDSNLERDVAVKLMRKELLANEEAVKRFAREARAVARLNHPNIVQVYTFGDQSGILYFVMEMVEGETITQRMKRCGIVSLQESVFMLLQAIEGLSYANARGIIHRDIKPSNLMLTPDYRVKIADFGLAKMVEQDTQMTAAGTTMGSPNYMSPEQARGEEADHRSDIYALGISWFQMLTGELPFTAQTPLSVLLKQIQEPLPEPPALKSLAEGKALEVIKKMTAKDPDARYQTYGGLAAAISGLAPDVRVKGSHVATTSMPAPQAPVVGSAAAGTGAAGAGAQGTDVLISSPDATRTGSADVAPGQGIPPPPPLASVAGTPAAAQVPPPAGDATRTYHASAPNATGSRALLVAAAVFALLCVLAVAALYTYRFYRPTSLNRDETTVAGPARQPAISAPTVSSAPGPSPAPSASPTPITYIIIATPTPAPAAPTVTEIPAPVLSTPVYSPTPAPTPTPYPVAQLVLGPNLPEGAPVPIRNEAGEVIGDLPAGMQIGYTQALRIGATAAYQVTFRGRPGYVSADNARVSFTAAGADNGPSSSTPAPRVMLELHDPGGRAGEVEVFSSPRPVNPSRRLPAGTEVQKIGEKDNMYRILLPGGREGWVLRASARVKP